MTYHTLYSYIIGILLIFLVFKFAKKLKIGWKIVIIFILMLLFAGISGILDFIIVLPFILLTYFLIRVIRIKIKLSKGQNVDEDTMNKRVVRMSVKPQWYEMLPNSVKPIDEQTIERVELFRNKHPGFTNERMFMAIMVSPWAVKRIQKYTLELIKNYLPTASDRELWARVLLARLDTKLHSPHETDPYAKPLSKKEILSRIENVDNIISDFKTFNDVVDYIIKMDEEENRFYDPTGIQKELNNILDDSKY